VICMLMCIHYWLLQNWNFVHLVIFQVLATLSIKMRAFWDIGPCSLVEVDWHFRGVYVGLLQWDCTALYPRRLSSSYSYINGNQFLKTVIVYHLFLPNFMLSILSRKLRWVGHLACIRKQEMCTKFCLWKSVEKERYISVVMTVNSGFITI
jgi:hypothetical protein